MTALKKQEDPLNEITEENKKEIDYNEEPLEDEDLQNKS